MLLRKILELLIREIIIKIFPFNRHLVTQNLSLSLSLPPLLPPSLTPSFPPSLPPSLSHTHRLLNRQRDEWGDRVIIVSCDMRSWNAPEKVHTTIIVLHESHFSNNHSVQIKEVSSLQVHNIIICIHIQCVCVCVCVYTYVCVILKVFYL